MVNNCNIMYVFSSTNDVAGNRKEYILDNIGVGDLHVRYGDKETVGGIK